MGYRRGEQPIPKVSLATTRGHALLLVLSVMTFGSCESFHPTGKTEKSEMVPLGYETVKRRLDYFAADRPIGEIFSPLRTRTRIAFSVDESLNLHVIRTANAPLGDESAIGPVEVAMIMPSGDKPLFVPIINNVNNAAFPVIVHNGAQQVIGVVGSEDPSRDVVVLRAYEALVARYAIGTLAEPVAVMGRVSDAIRVTVAAGGEIYALGERWFPPPASPSYIALRLAAADKNGSRMVADPVPGTDVNGSFPLDMEVYASGDGLIHIVYDGRRQAKQTESHLYHLVLGQSAKLEAVHDLGRSPRHPVITKVVCSPDGRLFLLVVYQTELDRKKFAHEIRPLEGIGQPGLHERYFVDFWHQAHVLWFDTAGGHYHGPGGVPSASPQ